VNARPPLMADESVVRDYLLLGLRLGRLVDGFVDCWFGDPELARQVAAEPPAPPTELAAAADRLLAEVQDSGLEDARRRFLAAQLTALRCAAGRLAGAETPFGSEVSRYFDVDITLGDPDDYADAHRAIAELLPGPGDLRARVDVYSARNAIPPNRLRSSVSAVSEELRRLVSPLFGLPETERVDYRVARGKPWNAFNRYRGGFRSTVTLNDQAGRAVGALPVLVTHESYPGHHTEHCVKEAVLVRGRAHREHCISLVNTPQCLVAEGIGELALSAVLGPGWGEWTAHILARHGVRLEGDLTEQLHAQISRLLPARQDAAIMLHDRGTNPDEASDYLQQWLLLPRDRAQHMVGFLLDPLWRAYAVTYIEGERLTRAWLDARPPTESVAHRFAALLREPKLPSDLRADLAAPQGWPSGHESRTSVRTMPCSSQALRTAKT
jgi:hypothetical protein